MPGWRSTSSITALELLGRAHQGIYMLDRLVVGVIGGGGPATVFKVSPVASEMRCRWKTWR